jgi:cobalamin biosynthesis protein CobT
MFKRRLELDGVDSAVVVVLDVSGSMFEMRYVSDSNGNSVRDANGDYQHFRYMDHAIKATAALLDTLTRAGVKVSLITFGSRTAVFKRFDEPLARGLSKLVKVNEGGNTNDYAAVRYAHELLARRPEARKAAFVITDGVGDADATAAQVKSGEALGISTVGIGICVDVKGIYPKSITIKNANDIGNASFKQIKLAA